MGRYSCTPLGIPNPPSLTSSGGHQSGQYAFYWNAFLFVIFIDTMFLLLSFQLSDPIRNVENFRNKKFYVTHGTLDSKYRISFYLLTSSVIKTVGGSIRIINLKEKSYDVWKLLKSLSFRESQFPAPCLLGTKSMQSLQWCWIVHNMCDSACHLL